MFFFSIKLDATSLRPEMFTFNEPPPPIEWHLTEEPAKFTILTVCIRYAGVFSSNAVSRSGSRLFGSKFVIRFSVLFEFLVLKFSYQNMVLHCKV
jgi:hypothetical protein